MRIKNKDIAEKLGISTTAVSLALNNRPGVSEETRRRVLELVNSSASEAMQSFHDINEPAGKSILMSVHKKHGHIINDKPFFSDIVETAQQELMKNGYNMILSHYVPGQNISQYIQYINSLPIAGVILMATEIDEEDLIYYKKMDIPLVLMDGAFDLEDLDCVELDNETAIFRAFTYAVKMGHRQIGFLKGKTFITNFGHHLDGFKKGIYTWNLEEETHPIITLPCDIQGAYHEMTAFLAHLPEGFEMPTIFLADLDYIALGAMQALKEHGYRIPEDISIIGYDDISISAVSDPPLTTSRVNHSDIGRFAAKVLLDRIVNPRNCHIAMQISSDLIIRQSVKDLTQK